MLATVDDWNQKKNRSCYMKSLNFKIFKFHLWLIVWKTLISIISALFERFAKFNIHALLCFFIVWNVTYLRHLWLYGLTYNVFHSVFGCMVSNLTYFCHFMLYYLIFNTYQSSSVVWSQIIWEMWRISFVVGLIASNLMFF